MPACISLLLSQVCEASRPTACIPWLVFRNGRSNAC